MRGIALDQQIVNLELLPCDEVKMMEVLSRGNMVAARSGNDFLYLIHETKEDSFRMYTHTPGLPEGGTKQFPRNEQNTALIGKLAQIADAVYLVEFEDGMNLFSVMASAEEGILSLFPGENGDQDGEIEFVIPGSDAIDGNRGQSESSAQVTATARDGKNEYQNK